MFASDPAAWLFLIVQECIFLHLSIQFHDVITRFERARRLIFAFLCFNGINSHLIKIVAKNAFKRFMSSSGAKMSLSGQKISIFCGQCRIFNIFNPENLGCVCRF
jgi:hypothetical protein